MTTVTDPLELGPSAPDLIDRIANALPDDVRADYYRELRHCRSLPENDEMLRLLRAMQFLVLLIEQAPSRMAEERERIEQLLTGALDKVSKASIASEAWHNAVQRRLAELPANIAGGIRPEVVAAKINEKLQMEFARHAIPQTAGSLSSIADRLNTACVEFSAASETIVHSHRGAAEDTRKAVASLNSEITQAAENAKKFSGEIADMSRRAWRGAAIMFAVGSLILGLALGMMFERSLLEQRQPVVQPAAAAQPAPVEKAVPQAPVAAKVKGKK